MDDKDKVRLLISDVGGESGTDFLYTDPEVTTFLELAGQNIFQAAADALRAIAGNEAQVAKRILFNELETDGPAVAESLRKLAESYDKRASSSGVTGGDWDWATWATDPFSQRYLRYGNSA
jgi:hypothetical protein